MKIYNEVTIDMNPESSTYGKHLSEDSYDYDGPLAKALNSDCNTYNGASPHCDAACSNWNSGDICSSCCGSDGVCQNDCVQHCSQFNDSCSYVVQGPSGGY